jgi:hypothetical protein
MSILGQWSRVSVHSQRQLAVSHDDESDSRGITGSGGPAPAAWTLPATRRIQIRVTKNTQSACSAARSDG